MLSISGYLRRLDTVIESQLWALLGLLGLRKRKGCRTLADRFFSHSLLALKSQMIP